jgi:hypothetical protein
VQISQISFRSTSDPLSFLSLPSIKSHQTLPFRVVDWSYRDLETRTFIAFHSLSTTKSRTGSSLDLDTPVISRCKTPTAYITFVITSELANFIHNERRMSVCPFEMAKVMTFRLTSCDVLVLHQTVSPELPSSRRSPFQLSPDED